MKKKILITVFLLCSIYGFTQTIYKTIFPQLEIIHTTSGINYRGIAGYGENPDSDIPAFGHIGTSAAFKSFHLILSWGDIETSDGVFNWTSTDAKINVIKSYGLEVGVQISVAPSPNYPNYITTLCGVYTTTDGIYPQYYNPLYKNRFYRMLTTAAQHFISIGVTYWSIVEGTTGDQSPNHGELTCCIGNLYVPQNGDDDNWEQFRRDAWDVANLALNNYGNTSIRLLINQSTDYQNLDYILGRYAGVIGKDGKSSHGYVFDGYSNFPLIPYIMNRGEVQGGILTAEHGAKNAMELSILASAAGLSILNTPHNYWIQMLSNTNETRPAEFFNRYANDTNAYYATHAFIHLGSFIGIDDVVRWTEGDYGALINPSQQTAYNNRIAAINAHAGLPPPGWGNSYKLTLKTNTLGVQSGGGQFKYVNNTRVTNLINNNGVGALYGYNSDDSYNNDFAFAITDNWSKYIFQNNSLSTSTLGFRGGSDTSIYGRFYKTIKTGQDLSFDIANTWAQGAGIANINFSIVYLDNNTATWDVLADVGSGMAEVATNTNINDGKWKVKTFSVSNMKYYTSEDFKIHTVSGGNTSFTLIEIGVL